MLQCHGDMDPMVPFVWGNATAMLLKQFNPEHDIVTLRGVMHSSSAQVRLPMESQGGTCLSLIAPDTFLSA